jgi:hypothetical protein
MRRQRARQSAITIEYLIFSIIILGIGACLLSFQDEITNTVTLAQSSLYNLQENMLGENDNNPATHAHNWKYETCETTSSETDDTPDILKKQDNITVTEPEVLLPREDSLVPKPNFSENSTSQATTMTMPSEGMVLDDIHHYCPVCGVIECHNFITYESYCQVKGVDYDGENTDYVCTVCELDIPDSIEERIRSGAITCKLDSHC